MDETNRTKRKVCFKTCPTVWREKKTLSFSPRPYGYAWDTIWNTVLEDGNFPDYILLLSEIDIKTYLENSNIQSKFFSDLKIQEKKTRIITTRTLFDLYMIDTDLYIFFMDEIHLRYAHLGLWEKTKEDAVRKIGKLLFYREIYGLDTFTPPVKLIWLSSYSIIDILNIISLYSNTHGITQNSESVQEDVLIGFSSIPSVSDFSTRIGNYKNIWSLNLKNTALILKNKTWIFRAKDIKLNKSFLLSDIDIREPGADCLLAYEFLSKMNLRIINISDTPVPDLWYGRDNPGGLEVYHEVIPTKINDLFPDYSPCPSGILENVFMNKNGLLYDENKFYGIKGFEEIWDSAEINTLSPSLVCKSVLVSYYPEEANYSCGIYTLFYLSKILRILAIQKESESIPYTFYCPEEKYHYDCLAIFNPPRGLQTTTFPPEKRQFYCKKAYLLPSSASHPKVEEADIEILRKSLSYLHGSGKWVKEITPLTQNGRYKFVVHEEDNRLSDHLYYTFKKGYAITTIKEKMSIDEIVETISGASAYLCTKKTSSWIWLLPLGADIFEIDSIESEEIKQLAEISGCNYTFISM